MKDTGIRERHGEASISGVSGLVTMLMMLLTTGTRETESFNQVRSSLGIDKSRRAQEEQGMSEQKIIQRLREVLAEEEDNGNHPMTPSMFLRYLNELVAQQKKEEQE